MTTIFLIERAWTDAMENHPSNAFGYSVVGFVEDEDKAREIVANGGVVPKGECWAVQEDKPRFRYRAVERMGPETQKPAPPAYSYTDLVSMNEMRRRGDE